MLMIFLGKMLGCVQGSLATVSLNSLNTSDTVKMNDIRKEHLVSFFHGTVNLLVSYHPRLKMLFLLPVRNNVQAITTVFKDFHNSNVKVLKGLISLSPEHT